MPNDDVEIRLGLTGEHETSRGLKRVADDERAVGAQATAAGAKAKAMGVAYSTATKTAGANLALLNRGVKYGAAGLAGLTIAGVKWGLSLNNQVEQARLRFGLFTSDVDGLTSAVRKIDLSSQFNFGDLSDAAALLGNQGVKNIPTVLQGIANAAAASGRGTQSLNSIALAIGQIEAKGRLSQEELNQILEAGGPGAQQAVQKAFGLTAKQLQNLGAQGLDANKAIQAITAEWTSGRMAGAAKRQLQSLGGQWDLFTGNAQKIAGVMTLGLAGSLEHDVLPAANRAADAIDKIFGTKGLSNEQKLRQARAVINRELGPIAHDLEQKIEDAIPGILEAMGKGGLKAAEKFGEGWLHASVWGKLGGGALLIHLLGLDKAALKAAGGALADRLGKGAKGGALGKLASKAEPVPVLVVNWPGGAPGAAAKKGGIVDKVKKAAPWAALGADIIPATATAGAAGAGTLVSALAPLTGIIGLALTHNENFPTRGPGASSPSNPAGHVPFIPGGPQRVTVDNHVQVTSVIDGRIAAQAIARRNAAKAAREG